MHTKLTLRLDEQLIENAKVYAARAGKSVSQIVTEYFKLLTTEKRDGLPLSAPVTKSLRGVLRNSKIDEYDYRKFLEEKHR